MPYHRKTVIKDPKRELGNLVMAYLQDHRPESPIDKESETVSEASKIKRQADEKYRPVVWHHKGSFSDKPGVAKISDMHEPPLRVSNLISKLASSVELGPYKPLYLRDFVKGIHNFWGSPIIESAALASIPAAAVWGIHKFTHPDKRNGQYTEAVAKHAAKLKKKDIVAAAPLKTDEEYLDEAVKERSASRLKLALGTGLAGALALHSLNINPKDWSQLYKYKEVPDFSDWAKSVTGMTDGVRKEGSMFGAPNALSNSFIQDAVANSINFDPFSRQQALDMLRSYDRPFMTPTDVVNQAVYTGASARAGLPLGRMAVAAAADAAAGYGAAKLFGAEAPGRWAALMGVGSFLNNLAKLG